MYVVVVNGVSERECRSFNEAKKIAEKRKGKVFKRRYMTQPLPKAATLHYGDSPSVKREMYREIYGENNHGFHATRFHM